jgi:hypothetical protein
MEGAHGDVTALGEEALEFQRRKGSALAQQGVTVVIEDGNVR